MKAIAADPYDAALRSVYSDFLHEQGEEAERRRQRWFARLLRGEKKQQLVFTRQGPLKDASLLWAGLPPAKKRQRRLRAEAVFQREPDAHFLIASSIHPTGCGFVLEPKALEPAAPRSPVLFWQEGKPQPTRVAVERLTLGEIYEEIRAEMTRAGLDRGWSLVTYDNDHVASLDCGESCYAGAPGQLLRALRAFRSGEEEDDNVIESVPDLADPFDLLGMMWPCSFENPSDEDIEEAQSQVATAAGYRVDSEAQQYYDEPE